jgi:hypothetical protein
MRILTMLCSITLIIMMLRTKGRSAGQLRPATIFTADGKFIEELGTGVRTTSLGYLPNGSRINPGMLIIPSMTEAIKAQLRKEPVIKAHIKHRTKDHPSDDFKLVVNYEVELSRAEQERIKSMVPSTPQKGQENLDPAGYTELPDQEI